MFHKVAFSGIVVTYNEDRWLVNCLHSLSFCDEVLVFDLGSTDNSVSISESFGAKVFHFERKPIVEEIRSAAMRFVRNDWVIFLDPDEIFPEIYEDLVSLIMSTSELGGIRIPLQYYFMEKKLTTTAWGKPRQVLRVVHKERVFLDQEIHKAISVQHPYIEARIDFQGENYIKHYWVDSYKNMIDKHLRYIAVEGETRFKKGDHFSLSECLKATYNALKNNLVKHRGWRGGWTGWFLSFFYAWYVFMCFISLWKFEVVDKKNNAFPNY